MRSRTEHRIGESPQDLLALSSYMDVCAAERGWPTKIRVALQVAVDEVVSNVVKYALPHSASGEATVIVTVDGNEVCVEVIDDGPAFDPTQAGSGAQEKTSSGVEIGGRGLRMTRRLMDSLDYARRDGRNHMLMVKRIVGGEDT